MAEKRKNAVLDDDDWKKDAIPVPVASSDDDDWKKDAIPVLKPSGELPFGTRARLSFASGLDERQGLLKKLYPGIEFPEDEENNLVKLPGESNPRYIDDPKTSFTDVADFVGDLPVMAGGALGGGAGLLSGGPLAGTLGLAVGSGAGEGVRKQIGHGLLGVPDAQSNIEKSQDIAMTGIAAPIFEAMAQPAVAGAKMVGKAASGLAKKGVAKVGGLLKPVTDAVEGYLPGLKGGAGNVFKDIENAIAQAEAKGVSVELPQLAEVEAAEKALPDLEYKVSPVQKSMYADKQTQDLVNALRVTPSKEGQALGQLEQLQKQELTGKMVDEVSGLSRGHVPRANPEDSGGALMDVVGSQYQGAKTALKPMFDAIDGAPVRAAKSHLASLRMMLGNTFSFLDGVTFGPGGIKLPPYSQKLGVSPKVYGLLKQTAKDLSDPKLTVRNLRAIRESLRQSVGPDDPGYTIVNNLRRGILDHLENIVSEVSPDLQVRSTFKSWAQNEAKKDAFEYMVGGSLDKNAPINLRAKPEKALERIFSSTSSVQAAQEMLGENFNQFLADYITQNAAKFTDKGVFSPQRFSSWLKTKAPMMRQAFKGNPQGLERINAITNLMRLIPDAPPGNPSGTAKTKTWIDLLLAPKATTKGLLKDRQAAKQGSKIAKKIQEKISPQVKTKKGSSKSSAASASQTRGLIREKIDNQKDPKDE